jgi:hypothetical protein
VPETPSSVWIISTHQPAGALCTSLRCRSYLDRSHEKAPAGGRVVTVPPLSRLVTLPT